MRPEWGPAPVPAKTLERILISCLGRRSDATPVPARILADEANSLLAATLAAKVPGLRRADVERILEDSSKFEQVAQGGWRLTPGGRHTFAELAPKCLSFSLDIRRPDVPEIPLYQWQRSALRKWSEAGRRGIIAAVTGAGKTQLGVAAIARHVKTTEHRAVVLVPTVDLMVQWQGRLADVFSIPVGRAGDGNIDRLEAFLVVVWVARSAADYLAQDVRRLSADSKVLLVADECHRYGAESYARALDAPYSATLGLSATPERDQDEGMEKYVLPALGPVIFEYHHDQAVQDDVIADFRVLFVGLDFDRREQVRYEQLDAELAQVWRVLVDKHPVLKKVTNFIEAVKLLAKDDEDGLARKWLSLTAERRRVMIDCGQRHAFVAWLATAGALSRQKCLIFHESIADCERLVEDLTMAGVRAASHHSDLNSTQRGNVLSKFRRGDLDVVIAPRTLDEGIDVPDAALAIIAAGTRVKRQSIQRIGRVLRRSEGKALARIVKLYVHGAVDDPTRGHLDAFARDVLDGGRGEISAWPGGEDRILGFLATDLVREHNRFGIRP